MAQFDVYKNDNLAIAEFFPYLLEVQYEILSSLKTRVNGNWQTFKGSP